MESSKTTYGGGRPASNACMQLRGTGSRKLDGVVYMAGVPYPADDPTVLKYRMHFRIADAAPPVDEVQQSSERLGDPEE